MLSTSALASADIVTLAVGLVSAAAVIAAAIMTVAVPALSASRRRRRERYAQMAAHLASWCELPFRVRRRVDDQPDTIRAITRDVHNLQEHLVLDDAELEAECPWLARARHQIESKIRADTREWVNEAWGLPPADNPTTMVLGGWGPPTELSAGVKTFTQLTKHRFGWRRATAPRWRYRKSRPPPVSGQQAPVVPTPP